MAFRQARTLDSAASIEQSERIASALEASGFHANLLHDALGEPVAVLVSASLSAADVSPIIAKAKECGKDPIKRVNNKDFGSALPYGTRSGRVYPYKVCEVIDIAARAATQRDDVAAARMFGPESGHEIGAGDASPHTDFPGNLDNPPSDDIHGLNVHVTLHGEGFARFSLIRSFEQVQEIAERIQSAKRDGKSVIEINETFSSLYEEFMCWATEPVRHATGDVFFFQSRPHQHKGLLPTVHHFESITKRRWYNVFVPKARDRSEVDLQRNRLIDTYGLEVLGYGRSFSSS